MYKDRAVFQAITNKRCAAVLTGAILGLFPAATAVAQSSDDGLLPIPQNRPSVESYSLPPGPGSRSDEAVVQGPVDEDVPQPRPILPPPTATPARAPPPSPEPESSRSAAVPAPTNRASDDVRQPASDVPPRAENTESPSVPEPDLASPGAAERQGPMDPSTDAASPSAQTAAEPDPESSTNQWLLLSFAALLLGMLGALLFWRARRAPPQQVDALVSERTESPPPEPAPPIAEPVQPAPTIALDFRPHAANATLINAVLSFELTLANQGRDSLTEIKVNGAMVQAEKDGGTNPASIDLSPLGEVQNLAAGTDDKILTEFRVPLATIRPIEFRSQALFVPLVHISIEYTDGSGFQHLQTATYMVGTEHQPPRAKMAPFRLDLGPRSFSPLGYRALQVV